MDVSRPTVVGFTNRCWTETPFSIDVPIVNCHDAPPSFTIGLDAMFSPGLSLMSVIAFGLVMTSYIIPST